MTFAEYYDGIDGDSLPVIQLTTEALGLQASGLCWVANIETPETADAAGGGKGSKSSPIIRMEVLGPRQAGSDKGMEPTNGGCGKGMDDDNRMVTARVCLMHADGTTYRVFSLPPAFLMFGD